MRFCCFVTGTEAKERSFRGFRGRALQKKTAEGSAVILRNKGLSMNAKFAEALKRTAVEHKQLGRRGVVHYLLAKGIPPEIVEGISGDDEEYLEAAHTFVEKKVKQIPG